MRLTRRRLERLKRMSTSNKTHTIIEYGGFVRGRASFAGFVSLPDRTFDALEAFILANYCENDAGAIGLLSLSARRGIGRIITARNYVGLITMKDGTVIEILPKIHGIGDNKEKTRNIFIEMLKTLQDVSFKASNTSSLRTDRLSLFEIFIAMFITEAARITKHGLQSSYTPIEANERFFKGKLHVPQDISHNYANRERCFVRYDEWSVNRPENRLIKATLLFLLGKTRDARNRLNISRLLTFFNGVDCSVDFEADFTKCAADRSMLHYAKALPWCKVFLRGNSFSTFAGSEVAIALLFPMDKVFESYIAAKLRRYIPDGFEMRTQDRRYSLFDHPAQAFALRPDIVLAHGGKPIVMDTKWKLLSNVRNYAISQADMYQMYAYGKKYDAEKIILVYPQPENLGGENISYQSSDGVKVEVRFIDLLQPDISASTIIDKFSAT